MYIYIYIYIYIHIYIYIYIHIIYIYIYKRQADCYAPRPDVWVLAPLGRGTHGYNWQGPGLWSAMTALDALGVGLLSIPADVDRVLFTGHSNGGFGAWLLAGMQPERAAACAPLSGMPEIEGNHLSNTTRLAHVFF